MASRINADSSNGLQLVSDSSGEIQFQSSGVTVATINSSGLSMTGGKTVSGVDALSTASGSAPSYSARAWVNFNGTGTPSIRASGNVSSITDNGTGDYTVNFATAMPDTDYSISTCPVNYTGDSKIREIALDNAISSASNVTVECGYESAGDAWTLADEAYLFLQVFR